MTATHEDRNAQLSPGVAIKAPCLAASASNVVLSGEQTIDGVACVDGDRVLLRGQTNTVENGIYVVSTGTWSRAQDFDGNRDIVEGTIVFVTDGTPAFYRVTGANPILIDISSIGFVEVVLPSVSADTVVLSNPSHDTTVTLRNAGASTQADFRVNHTSTDWIILDNDGHFINAGAFSTGIGAAGTNDYIQIRGTASGSPSTLRPIISAEGPDTDIYIDYYVMGNGSHVFRAFNGGCHAGVIAGRSTATNFWEIRSQVAGSGPSFQTQGSPDVDVDGEIWMQGVGSLKIRGNGGTTVDGLFESMASSVNWPQFTPAVTGSGPIIKAIGTDSVVPLNLTPQGTDAKVIQNGIFIQPVQPSFSAYNSSSDANATGDGTTVTVQLDTEIFDRGADFASNTFTAPVAGLYPLFGRVQLSNIGAAHTDVIVEILTSNRTYLWREIVGAQPRTTMTVDVVALADMDAADTAVLSVTVSGSTKTVTVVGGTNQSTIMSGFLMG